MMWKERSKNGQHQKRDIVAALYKLQFFATLLDGNSGLQSAAKPVVVSGMQLVDVADYQYNSFALESLMF